MEDGRPLGSIQIVRASIIKKSEGEIDVRCEIQIDIEKVIISIKDGIK